MHNLTAQWDEGTTYFANTSFCQVNGVVYQSLTDNNTGNNPTTDTTNWETWKPLEGTYANIDLSNLSETGNAHFANPDLSNLSDIGLDKINQSKALETGNVSSDKEVYADVLKYAHSTFDKSKFEIVGSPVITDDGIASGFEGSNRVKATIPYSSGALEITAAFYFTPDPDGANIFQLRDSSGIKSIFRVYLAPNNNLVGFRWLFGCPHTGKYLPASIIHDWILEHPESVNYNRQFASRIFKQALLNEGVKPLKAQIMYLAVDIWQTVKNVFTRKWR